jgi:hypothetical protein
MAQTPFDPVGFDIVGYGHQWRYFNASYKGCDADYSGQGVDQLNNIIKSPRQRGKVLKAIGNVGVHSPKTNTTIDMY